MPLLNKNRWEGTDKPALLALIVAAYGGVVLLCASQLTVTPDMVSKGMYITFTIFIMFLIVFSGIIATMVLERMHRDTPKAYFLPALGIFACEVAAAIIFAASPRNLLMVIIVFFMGVKEMTRRQNHASTN